MYDDLPTENPNQALRRQMIEASENGVELVSGKPDASGVSWAPILIRCDVRPFLILYARSKWDRLSGRCTVDR